MNAGEISSNRKEHVQKFEKKARFCIIGVESSIYVHSVMFSLSRLNCSVSP